MPHHEALDRGAAVATVLVLHLVVLAWLATRPTTPFPASAADAALQVVFVERTPALPLPPPAPTPARLPDASPAPPAPAPAPPPMAVASPSRPPTPTPRPAVEADATVVAPDAHATGPVRPTWQPGPPAAPGARGAPGAPPASPRFVRDPLGAPPVDLVSVPPPVRLRLPPPPSLQRTVGKVAAFLAPAGYEANPCPRIGRNLAVLASDGSDGGRAAMGEELRRRERLCD